MTAEEQVIRAIHPRWTRAQVLYEVQAVERDRALPLLQRLRNAWRRERSTT